MSCIPIVVTHLLGVRHLTGFAAFEAAGIETEQRLRAQRLIALGGAR